MNGFLQSLLTFVLIYKYVAIFLINVLASLSLPLPGSAVIIASTFFASEGYLSLTLVFLVALSSSILGDMLLYWFAKQFGRKLLLKIGLRRLIDSSGFTRLESRFKSHPFLMVIVTRFGGSVTPLASFVAGHAKMSFRKFLIADIIGESVSTAGLCVIGYIFGDNWDAIVELFERFYIFITLVFILIVFLMLRRRSRRARAAR